MLDGRYDNCNCGDECPKVVERFTAMSEALNRTERPVLYSMCIWGTGDVWKWGPKARLPLLCDAHALQADLVVLPQSPACMHARLHQQAFKQPTAWRSKPGPDEGPGAEQPCVQVGNSWRTTADISYYWDSILRCLDNSIGLARFAGPGHWNDLDMLEARPDSPAVHALRLGRPCMHAS